MTNVNFQILHNEIPVILQVDKLYSVSLTKSTTVRAADDDNLEKIRFLVANS